MRRLLWAAAALLPALSLPALAQVHMRTLGDHSELFDSPLSIFAGDTPAECPPCFNCNLADFKCHQFANCTAANGRCSCPPGFGGEDCTTPTCGSLADGKDRAPRTGKYCECSEGWEGINCNICKTNSVCSAFTPEGTDGVCYKGGLVVNENYQVCNITNKKIVDQLKDKPPQATFSCNKASAECNFQCKLHRIAGASAPLLT